MKYQYESWPIKKLVELYDGRCLELNPPYQRNPIWSSSAQKELVESVLSNRPMPNFFMLQKSDGMMEVVDGKQRALTIFAFWRGQLQTEDGSTISTPAKNGDEKTIKERFLEYLLNVTVITELASGESIQAFYALVNSTGLRLNRPEIRKAEFYTTNLLRLVTNLAALNEFHELGLFTRLSAQRMNDVDFVSELISQIHFGITDKKEKVDDLYKQDISEVEFTDLRNEFLRVLALIVGFDSILPISKTRYRQKNDFYTFFGFLHFHPELDKPTLDYFYRLLIKVGPYIRPSQERCEPLKTYALNCVTQSNSKNAREDRLKFFERLLLNREAIPNDVQSKLLSYFKLDATSMAGISNFYTIKWDDVRDPDQGEFLLVEGHS